MIPANTSKSIRTHRNIRSLRSLPTTVGPAQGQWLRLRETEQLAQRRQPAPVRLAAVRPAPHH